MTLPPPLPQPPVIPSPPLPPLHGITVLDLTHMLAGPFGTMLLADLGARTIKVEPLEGEGTRRLLDSDPRYARDGMGAYFLTLNRNKESVAIDLKQAAGRALFLDLVRAADVVVDNFAPGVMQRLQLDAEALQAANPRIVSCSVTGFGGAGGGTGAGAAAGAAPSGRPAFDQVVQAIGGGMSITGQPDGPPTRSGIPIGDLGGGVFAALGILAALQARGRDGRGRHVDLSMLDVQISLLNYMATMHLMSGLVPGRIGNAHFVHVPYNTYATADGHIIIACIGDAFFERLAALLDVDELRTPAWRTQPGRLAARERIDALVAHELARHDNATWLARLEAARVPCGPVNDFGAALSDPQIIARGMLLEVPLADGERLRMPGNPIKMSDAGVRTPSAPPGIGAQTREVLAALAGCSPERLDELQRSAVIA